MKLKRFDGVSQWYLDYHYRIPETVSYLSTYNNSDIILILSYNYSVCKLFMNTDVRMLFLYLHICDRIWETDHIVTIDISRNTDLKYRSRHGSLVLDCSHARFAV